MVNVSIPTKIPLSFVKFSKNLSTRRIYKLCMFDRLNVWNWLRDLRLTVHSSIPICLFFNNVFDTLHYDTFQFDGKWLPVSNKKYILRSMPTTLLFSLLFSMAGTLPHLSSEDHLSAPELAPDKAGWLRLVSFSSAPSLLHFAHSKQPSKRLHNLSSKNGVRKFASIPFKKGQLSFSGLNAGSHVRPPLRTANVL